MTETATDLGSAELSNNGNEQVPGPSGDSEVLRDDDISFNGRTSGNVNKQSEEDNTSGSITETISSSNDMCGNESGQNIQAPENSETVQKEIEEISLDSSQFPEEIVDADDIKEPKEEGEEETEDNSADRDEDTETEEKDANDGWIFVLGHDKLKKKTLVAGKGIGTRPSPGQRVTLSYSAQLEDGTEVDKQERHTFCLGEEEVITALDLCVALMELAEICEIVTEPQYAYGKKGRSPDIPPDAKLTYKVELLVIEDAPNYSILPVSIRVSEADKKRVRGNELYTRSAYSSSINCYTKALSILDDSNESHKDSAEELQSLVDTRVKCYNNLAAAQLKVEAWDAAIKSCDSVLKIQPENVKALFRKGKCLANKGELEQAIPLLRKAVKLEPETKIIHQELSRLVFKLKSQENSARAMYQKMLGTDQVSSKSSEKNHKKKSHWWMWLGGATLAAGLSVGIAAYRYLHV